MTQEEILETINNKNVSGIFMKDFNFIDLLGNIRYDEEGKIVGEYVSNMNVVFLEKLLREIVCFQHFKDSIVLIIIFLYSQ